MHEGSIRDLSAAAHVELMDPAQVHKSCIRDLSAIVHEENLDPLRCTKAASVMVD